MNRILILLVSFFAGIFLFSCKASKQINKVIAPRDTISIVEPKWNEDSVNHIKTVLADFQENHIQFNTFSAKIKVDIEDSKGKQPDITAVVRMVKDSAIWISLSATFLNIELYRVLIKPDSVILLNKQDREVNYRSLDYLQEMSEIPIDFSTLQDLIVGNPVFYSDSIISYREVNGQILIGTIGPVFKNLLTLGQNNKLLQHIKLDDVNLSRNRTADITYDNYEAPFGFAFSTTRQITVSEKNKLDIRLKFKQYEFNKELSLPFNIPRNYKHK